MNNINTTPATAIANNEPIVATADSPVNSATLKTPVVLGIDIGGTNLRVGLVDALGALVDSRRVSSQEALSGNDPMTKLADYLEGYLAEMLDGKYELKAISVGFPSVVDATRTVVLQTTFIPGLNNVNVPERLSRFGVPVFIDRDVNMIIRYDAKRLNLQNLEGVTFGCYVGTGIGCALAVDGKILDGLHGVAGELGHIYEATGRTCGCGLEGCSKRPPPAMRWYVSLKRTIRAPPSTTRSASMAMSSSSMTGWSISPGPSRPSSICLIRRKSSSAVA